jgi:Heterokaryon incompatibility protein Het-C
MKTINLSAIAAGVCAAVLGAVVPVGYGFKPAYESHGHTMITQGVLTHGYAFGLGLSGAFDGVPLVVSKFQFRYASDAQPIRSVNPAAARMIVLGVQSRDWLGLGDTTDSRCSIYPVPFVADDRPTTNYIQLQDGFGKCLYISTSGDLDDADGHFDNDNFGGSARSLRAHLNQAISFARVAAAEVNSDSDAARAYTAGSRLMLGKAIHTLQDFYAHSSWAENNPHDAVFTPLSEHAVAGGGFSSAVRARLASPRPVSDQGSDPLPIGLGTADFDACLARIEITGIGGWESNSGNYQVAASPTSPITSSAWWRGSAGLLIDKFAASDLAGNSRCDHGVSSVLPYTSNTPLNLRISGIAKDMPGWPLRPGPNGRLFPGGVEPTDSSYGLEAWAAGTDAKSLAARDATGLHLKASFQAAQHTKQLLDVFVQLVQNATASSSEGDRLLGVVFGEVAPPPSVAFVLDRSGTMADVLPNIVTTINASAGNIPRTVLVDFAGLELVSGLESRTTVGDAARVAARLAAIEARGGGGCATPLWSAIEKAVEASIPNSVIIAFTDASASDPHKEESVKAAAQAKGIKINKIVSGSCSPLDPSYSRGAQATGGTAKLVTHDEDGIAAALATLDSDVSTSRTVHTEAATLPGSKLVSFPVETGATKLTIVAHGVLTGTTVTQPNGSPLVAGPGVTISSVLNGYAYAITNPQQGAWQVSMTGSGEYSLSVYVNAPIAFESSEHKSVLKVGRPGHEYRPQLAKTGQSGRVWFKAQITGAQAPVVLDLLRLNGTVISSFPLSKMTDNYFEGEITLPTEAHRLRARGFAADNTAFARIFGQGNVAPAAAAPGRIIAQQSTSPTWRAGTVNAFAVNLKNLGGNDTVSLGAGTLPSGATLNCLPNSVALPESEQVNVLCSLQLPDAPDRGDFTVAVTTASGPQQVTIPLRPLKLPLSCALDIDGDNRVNPEIDAVLLTRYLLGFKDAALTAGITIPGPRKDWDSLSQFFGNAAQFDLVGRATPRPTAMVDGLIMTRLMLGVDGANLLNGIQIPAGAQFATSEAIKENIISKCAGGF